MGQLAWLKDKHVIQINATTFLNNPTFFSIRFFNKAKKIDNQLSQSILQSKRTMTRAILFLTLLCVRISSPAGETNLPWKPPGSEFSFNVRDFGAKGDAQTKDTVAF